MRKQLLAIYLGLMVLTLLVTYVFVANNVTAQYIAHERQQLADAAVLFASQNNDILPQEGKDLAQTYADHMGVRVTFISNEGENFGEVLFDTEVDPSEMANHGDREEVAAAVKNGEGFAVRKSPTTRKSYLYYAKQEVFYGDDIIILRFAKSAETLNAIQGTLTKTYVFLCFGIIVVGMLLFFLLSRSVFSPLHDLTSRIKQMEDKSTISFLPNYEDPHVDQLADSFNRLMVLLNENVDRLRQNNKELQNVFENVTSGLIMLDQSGRIRVINQPALDLLDIREDDSIDNFIYGLVRHPDLLIFLQESMASLERQDFEIAWENERVYYIQLSPLPMEDKPEEIMGTLIVIEDMTEIRSVDNMRKDFVANVSHELRTPLTTIRGFVETLLHDDLTNPTIIRKFLGIIEMEADRLQTMIFQLLYLSHLDNKVQDHDFVTIQLDKFMERFLYPIQEKIEEKGIAVSYEIVPDHLSYQGSENLLHQVLSNLVENALDYSQGTRITIRFEERPKGIFLEVEDDGIGIAKKDQPRIYERFYRVEKSRAQSKGGTGLGLAIVKHLVGNVGGRITLHSDLGKGTQFRVLLPYSHD